MPRLSLATIALILIGVAGAGAQQVMQPPTPTRAPSSDPSSVTTVDLSMPTMPKGTGTILGRVVEDRTSLAVGDALVTLNLSGSRSVSVITAADGRFLFRDVPHGRFTLFATQAGYLPGAWGRLRPSGPSQVIDLDEGARRTDLTIALWKQGVITGQVVDEASEPMVNMELQVLQRLVVAGTKRFSVTGKGTTDDRGIYRIWGLVPGDYAVALPIKKPAPDAAFAAAYDPAGGSPPLTYDTMFYASASSLSRATLVEVGSGEEKPGINFAIRPVAAVPVAGVVSTADGPVARVPVTLSPADATESSAPIETAVTLSDANGAFVFTGITPGQYTLRAIKMVTAGPGTSTNAVDRLLPQAGSTTLWAEVPVTVADAGVSGIAAILQPGLHVSGTLQFDDGPRPAARDVTALEVFLSPTDGHLAALASRGPVQADDTFLTTGVLPGQYVVRVAGQLAGWSLESARYGGRDVSDLSLELNGADVTNVVLTFTQHPTRITGAVTNATGIADPAASVVVFPADSGRWEGQDASARGMRRVRVTPAGQYSVSNLPPGSYFIAAIPEAQAASWDDLPSLAALARSATRLVITAHEQKTQDLRTSVEKSPASDRH